jgi:hypothetical protein
MQFVLILTGIFGILTGIAILCKLLGQLMWGWLIVFSPLMVAVVLLVSLILVTASRQR